MEDSKDRMYGEALREAFDEMVKCRDGWKERALAAEALVKELEARIKAIQGMEDPFVDF